MLSSARIKAAGDSPAQSSSQQPLQLGALKLPPAPKSLQRARIRLFVFMCFAALAFGGATFGWGPMQIILEENGNYGHLCAGDDSGAGTTSCPEQRSALLLVSTITSFMFVTAPFWGYLIDHRGPLLGIILSSLLVWTGLSCLTIASFFPGRAIDPLLYLAFICLMTVSILSNILFIHAGLVFDKPESTQRAISILNTLFDAGALTYLILYQMTLALTTQTAPGWVLVGYLGLSVIVYGGAVWSWQRVSKEDTGRLQSNYSTREEDRIVKEGGQDSPLSLAMISADSTEDVSRSDADGKGDFQDNELENGLPASKTAACTDGSPNSNEADVPISELPPSRQLRTRMFILHAIFFGIVAARNTFVLATAKSFLAYLGDDDYLYLKIFTLLQPASILGLPVMNWVIKKKGYHVALQCINVLGLLHGIIQVSTNNLNIQVLGFLIFSFYRCFVLAICFGFLPTYLGMTVVGRGAGILTLSKGIMCAVNIPLAVVAINRLDGNFFWPNLALTLVSIPCVAMAWYIGWDIQRNEQAKDNYR